MQAGKPHAMNPLIQSILKREGAVFSLPKPPAREAVPISAFAFPIVKQLHQSLRRLVVAK